MIAIAIVLVNIRCKREDVLRYLTELKRYKNKEEFFGDSICAHLNSLALWKAFVRNVYLMPLPGGVTVRKVLNLSTIYNQQLLPHSRYPNCLTFLSNLMECLSQLRTLPSQSPVSRMLATLSRASTSPTSKHHARYGLEDHIPAHNHRRVTNHADRPFGKVVSAPLVPVRSHQTNSLVPEHELFGGLVAQVKQLLIPVQQPEEDAASTTSVVLPNGDDHKSQSTISPESKVKSVSRPSDQTQDQSPNEDSSVKRCTNDSIAPSSDPDAKNRAVVCSLTEPELQKQQIIKNSSIKVEPSDSVELPKKTTHYAIKSVPRPTDNSVPEGGTLVVESCVGITNMVKRKESGGPEDPNGTNRPVKRQRTESSKDHQADQPETVSPASKFPCETCGKSFTRRDHLKDHNRIHQGAKLYHCKWPDCSYASAKSGGIYRHIRALHFKQSRKKGAAQDDGDQRDPKEFVQVDKELLN